METALFYNDAYERKNYFRYRRWLYAPFVSGLVAYCGLKPGALILDVGCGQGFFSYLFSRNGMKVHGIDISEAGVRTAAEMYGRFGAKFAVADVETMEPSEVFDCVFVRSCSLYNTETFADNSRRTEALLRHLKPGGTFIFVYNSNFSSRVSPTWRYHSLQEVLRHFRRYPNAQAFFLNRLGACVLRRFAFTGAATWLSVLLSRLTGMGGELVCILRKPYPGSRSELQEG